jgi:hypothetical protein
MATATFDTLKFANKLKQAGVPDKQAEAEAEALAEALAVNLRDLVTKDDLQRAVEQLRREMAELKADMIKWMVGLSFAQIALLVGILLKLL